MAASWLRGAATRTDRQRPRQHVFASTPSQPRSATFPPHRWSCRARDTARRCYVMAPYSWSAAPRTLRPLSDITPSSKAAGSSHISGEQGTGNRGPATGISCVRDVGTDLHGPLPVAGCLLPASCFLVAHAQDVGFAYIGFSPGR